MSESESNIVRGYYWMGHTMDRPGWEDEAREVCNSVGWKFLGWGDPKSSTNQDAYGLSIDVGSEPVDEDLLDSVLARFGVHGAWVVGGEVRKGQ